MKHVSLLFLSLCLFACAKPDSGNSQLATAKQLKMENDATKVVEVDTFMLNDHDFNVPADAVGNKRVKTADFKTYKNDTFSLTITFSDGEILKKNGKLIRDYDSDDISTASLDELGSFSLLKPAGSDISYCARISTDSGVTPLAPSAPIQVCESTTLDK